MAITFADIAAKRAETLAAGQFFELEELEVDGHVYPVYKHAPATSLDLLQGARGHGEAPFLVYEDQRYSYTQFYEQADALAAALQGRYGISKGDRVAIAMRNNPQWSMAFAAATLAGAVVVPINSWGKTDELSYALDDSGASLLVCDPARLALIESQLAARQLPVILVGGSADQPAGTQVVDFESIVAGANAADFQPVPVTPQDQCLILYTSGSTGFPKGVVHRHIAVCQSLMNMMWLGMLTMSLEGIREFRGGATVETPMLTVPLFHGTGLLSGFYLPLFTGQKVVMMYKWDTVAALQLIEREKVTSLSSVPAIVQDLLAHPEFDRYDTSSLIRVSCAGAATPAGLPELIEEKCSKPSRSAGYGMTETLAVGGSMSGCIYDLKPDASGLVSPIMQLRMVDPEGRVMPPGEPGEIEFYGITCTPGYWEKPEANAATFSPDRWMKSGDVGYVDAEGFIHITGRIKEIVIRGGENIFPGEIEDVAYQLESVHEAVVFGEPDQVMGEELVMVIFVTPGMALDERTLREHLSARLAAYKVPRTMVFADSPLPRNASEKLHKLKVREAHLAGLAG